MRVIRHIVERELQGWIVKRPSGRCPSGVQGAFQLQ